MLEPPRQTLQMGSSDLPLSSSLEKASFTSS